MINLNATDLQKMSAREVAGLADLDFYSVRDEGYRRQTAAERKITRLRKQLAAAQQEMDEAAQIIEAALGEQNKAA
jgi:hypothetical protein